MYKENESNRVLIFILVVMVRFVDTDMFTCSQLQGIHFLFHQILSILLYGGLAYVTGLNNQKCLNVTD